MKILLDECLPLDFRHALAPHEVHTTDWAGFKGKKNGELLRLAEQAGCDVFVTVDRGIPRQQNLAGRHLAILAIRARTNQLEGLLPLADAVLAALRQIYPGRAVLLGP